MIYKYILFVYINYIQEDWETVTKIGRILLKPAWFIRSIFYWIFSFSISPFVFFYMKITELLNIKALF